MALDGNGRWAYLDPKLGAMHAVAECCAQGCHDRRNPGGRDQLPELRQPGEAGDHGPAFRGHRRHRRGLHRSRTPITGGNVSLYNETRGEGIYPTPVLGIVGILDDVTKAVPADFPEGGRRDSAALAGSQG